MIPNKKKLEKRNTREHGVAQVESAGRDSVLLFFGHF
jgi:hypothetical protein